MRHFTWAVWAHAIACTLNAWFLLSLYCSWCLYSVTSRRWTNDHWLNQSLKWAGQTLIMPSTTHVSVNLPFEVSKQFLDHQPTRLAWPRASPPHHWIHHAAQHTSQTTCHFQTLATCFIFFYTCKYCTQLINHAANGGFTAKSACMIAI